MVFKLFVYQLLSYAPLSYFFFVDLTVQVHVYVKIYASLFFLFCFTQEKTILQDSSSWSIFWSLLFQEAIFYVPNLIHTRYPTSCHGRQRSVCPIPGLLFGSVSMLSFYLRYVASLAFELSSFIRA